MNFDAAILSLLGPEMTAPNPAICATRNAYGDG